MAVSPESNIFRGAIARVALASKDARISDKHGSKERADANSTLDCSVMSCAMFFAEI